MQKWTYALVSGMNPVMIYPASVVDELQTWLNSAYPGAEVKQPNVYFALGAKQKINMATIAIKTHSELQPDFLFAVLRQMGSSGWEMISVGNGNQFWFKKPV